jgi:hypothetical protein
MTNNSPLHHYGIPLIGCRLAVDNGFSPRPSVLPLWIAGSSVPSVHHKARKGSKCAETRNLKRYDQECLKGIMALPGYLYRGIDHQKFPAFFLKTGVLAPTASTDNTLQTPAWLIASYPISGKSRLRREDLVPERWLRPVGGAAEFADSGHTVRC